MSGLSPHSPTRTQALAQAVRPVASPKRLSDTFRVLQVLLGPTGCLLLPVPP